MMLGKYEKCGSVAWVVLFLVAHVEYAEEVRVWDREER